MRGASKKTSLSKLIANYKTSWKLSLACRLVLVGLAYGYIGALHNQNPYYPAPKTALPEKAWSHLRNTKLMFRAYAWRPSPFWFPSYPLCKLPPEEPGIGISWTKSGYLFRSYAGLYLYRFSSTVLGGAMGLVLAIVVDQTRKHGRGKGQWDAIQDKQ
jgi:hypothetical protein